MKKLAVILLMCALGCCVGWSYTVDNLPVVTEYRDSTDFTMVCNPDGILTPQEVDSLNAMLWTIRQTKDVQGYVVCIKEMDPDDPYEFGIRVFNKYGIGGKTQNAGFLVLLATENRGYYINTGEGIEKYLTDAQCSTIERHYMVPRFKEGNWGAGIIDGVKMICDVCSGEAELNASNESESSAGDDGDAWLGFLIIFGPMIGCGGLAAYQSWRKKKCPKCGEHKLKHVKRVITKVTKMSKDGKRVIPLKSHIEDYYTCESCKYQQVMKFDARYDEYKEGTFYGGLDNWGAIIAASSTSSGGYGRGRSSSSWGGGSSHSSFGGGFSSGGGAGGRF